MKALFVGFVLCTSAFADTMTFDLKLVEAANDNSEARFSQGNRLRATTNAFGMVQCWGINDRNSILIEDANTRSQFYAEFSSTSDCKSSIKKAKGTLGMRYGTLRFTLDLETKKVISYYRL